MKRLPDWPVRYSELIRKYRESRFKWGRSDCFIFATDAVEALTGQKVLPPIPYKNRKGCVEWVSSLGGAAPMISATLGEPIPPMLASVGDIGLTTDKDFVAFCINNGSTWFALGRRGLVNVSGDVVHTAWKI